MNLRKIALQPWEFAMVVAGVKTQIRIPVPAGLHIEATPGTRKLAAWKIVDSIKGGKPYRKITRIEPGNLRGYIEFASRGLGSVSRRVQDVRVVKLDDITESDARAEGWRRSCCDPTTYAFHHAWLLNGRNDDTSDWVWRVVFAGKLGAGAASFRGLVLGHHVVLEPVGEGDEAGLARDAHGLVPDHEGGEPGAHQSHGAGGRGQKRGGVGGQEAEPAFHLTGQ